LSGAVGAAEKIASEVLGMRWPDGDFGSIWAWAVFYVVLGSDFADSKDGLSRSIPFAAFSKP